MCLFPYPNTNYNGKAYKKGLTEFECGRCPECLHRRSKQWALRSQAEAFNNIGCMVTLTYDQYIHDSKTGKIIGERVDTRALCKADCQKFIKRLRKHYNGVRIKYLIAGERGKHTDRAHYHCVLFGIDFREDRCFYKTSKRGNRIYKSPTLEKIWKNGICTVDSVNINGKVARYCTKYTAKERSDDTFMLFSQGIGEKYLLEHFNGKNYFFDGVEYAIPKIIWNKVLQERFDKNYVLRLRGCSYKYKTKESCYKKALLISVSNTEYLSSLLFDENIKQRRLFSKMKEKQRDYIDYINYWNNKSEVYKTTLPSVFERIKRLDNKKYFSYKQKALQALNERSEFGSEFTLIPNGVTPKRFYKVFLHRFDLTFDKNNPLAAEILVNMRQVTPKTKRLANYSRYYDEKIKKVIAFEPIFERSPFGKVEIV